MKPRRGMGRLQRVGAEAGCAPASRGPKAPWGTRRMYHGSWRPGSSPNASRFCPNRRWPLFRGLAIQETQVADFNVEGRTRLGKVERKVRGRMERERETKGAGRPFFSQCAELVGAPTPSFGRKHTWGRSGVSVEMLPVCSQHRFLFSPVTCGSNEPTFA